MSNCLYRHYSSDGALLYVGISNRFHQRLKEHSKGSAWFPEISYVEVEHFDTRDQVRDAERQAIESERPKYNIVHNANMRGIGTPLSAPMIDAPRVEFFWIREQVEGRFAIATARLVKFPVRDEEFWYGTEYASLLNQREIYYSTYGYSTSSFSRWNFSTTLFDLLGDAWANGEAYLIFLDDILDCRKAGLVPDHAGPMIARALHVERYNHCCINRDRNPSDKLDKRWERFSKLFNEVLKIEHFDAVKGGAPQC